jgi:hypothetical protein
LLGLLTPQAPGSALTSIAIVPTAPFPGHEWRLTFLEMLVTNPGATNILVLATLVALINDLRVYQRQISFTQNNPFFVVAPFRDQTDLGDMVIYNNDPIQLQVTLQPTAGANRLFADTTLNAWGTIEG